MGEWRAHATRMANLEEDVHEIKLILALDRVKRQWHRHELARNSNHDNKDNMDLNQPNVIVKRWQKKSPTRLVFMDQSA